MQPAKRRRRSPAASTARPSKLARENNLSAAEEQEIQAAFTLFAIPHQNSSHQKVTGPTDGVLPVADVRRVLIALSLTPTSAELQEYLSILDPDSEGFVEYEPFVAICALKMQSRMRTGEDHQREVDEAWDLFDKNHEERITLATLREVAERLGQEVTDEVLRDMLLEANGGAGVNRGVDKGEFESVMRRAGVWR
ncbi:BgTH12-06973 [Blumeria graminis f. sp. triticale]|uniref:BgTH12-06973 n=3 Tax=Blumeria graminis TaxID=34373 RepID=A0A9W4D8F8_BLUGR|nr:BgTH12-06973 [Blumeria graminis f. sp. triticale]